MVTKEQIIAALKTVDDPELKRDIVTLNMVGDINIEGSMVEVEIRLTVQGCPLVNRIEEDVRNALLALPDIEEVKVRTRAMTDEERAALARGLAMGTTEMPKTGIYADNGRTKVIAIGSGKGGVGKSTVSANLAVAVAQKGYRVGLLDADIYGFSIPRMLGVGGPPVVLGDKIVPIDGHGVQVMSMGFFVEEDTSVIWRASLVIKALDQFLKDVAWSDLDYLFIDLPPGTGDIPLSLVQQVPWSQLLIVTTPQQVSTQVASRLGMMAEKTQQEVIGVVENMSYFVCPDSGKEVALFGEGGGQLIADKLSTPLLGKVPLEMQLRENSDIGKPTVIEQPDSLTAQAINEIADQVIARARYIKPVQQEAEKQLFIDPKKK